MSVTIEDVQAAAGLLDEIFSSYNPPASLTVSQWADKRRIVSAGTSPFPGRWQTSRVPYLREIMDCFSAPGPCHVVAMMAVQIAKTELLLNLVAYFIDVDPSAILIVQPTLEAAERFSMKRLSPMLKDSPTLRAKVADPKSRSGGNTLRYKRFTHGDLINAGSNSEADLTGAPIKCAFLDELDQYQPITGGHPRDLALARTTAYSWTKKVLEVSTPGDAETSLIFAGYKESTMGQWFVPCPGCEYFQILEVSRVNFKRQSHECDSCKKEFPRHKWLAAQRRGEWRHQHPERKKRGYHLSSVCSPWLGWNELGEEFFVAQKRLKEHDYSKWRFFKNNRMAEPSEGQGEKLDYQELYDRREVYEAEVPDGVLLLTCAVDIGEQYIVWEVSGWGFNNERWAIETSRIEGTPYQDETWERLASEVLVREFARANGIRMRISKMVVDSQHARHQVCLWTKINQPRTIAIRGQGGAGLSTVHNRTYTEENARLATLGSDALKDEMVARLGVKEPGPAYWHFPMQQGGNPTRGYDLQFFQELCNEKRIAKSVDGFTKHKWTKLPYAHNEAFDLACYSIAALEIFTGGNTARAYENAHEALARELNPPRQFTRPPDPRRHIMAPPGAPPPGGFGSTEEASPWGPLRPKSGRGNF